MICSGMPSFPDPVAASRVRERVFGQELRLGGTGDWRPAGRYDSVHRKCGRRHGVRSGSSVFPGPCFFSV